MVEKAQAELWSGPPYPPRTMVEVRNVSMTLRHLSS
jgi:hypothetical protein